MKFSEYPYIRPNVEDFLECFSHFLREFKVADSVETVNKAMEEMNKLRNSFETTAQVCYVRYTIDTTDEFYKAEREFFSDNSPKVEEVVAEFYEALLTSPFRNELESKWGKQLFNLAEVSAKTISKEVIEDLQKENKIKNEYTKLLASAKIMFDGEERAISQMEPFFQHKDREKRKNATNAMTNFFVENAEELDRIYDELVHLRVNIAKKLGYKNFIELGYARLGRTDYNAEMVKNFRDQVHTYIVPLAVKLKERQQKRIGVDKLYFYDEKFRFETGNPTPKGSPEWIVQNGKTMYKEMSPETNEFFQFMVQNELMDLVAKKGKRLGGYCTNFPDYEAPFIFSNFNGTSGDIDVLTHEVGHAFQIYESRKFAVPEYYFPTLEACEIHSMSMEFFAWDWMELFFKEDTEKYLFEHLSESLLFLPYGVSVDEFQHFVYENPDASSVERKAAWRTIEKKYLPWRDYDGDEFLESGGFWQRQGHIYNTPFYYIDYTLAQTCAFQFWKRANENKEDAWNDYVKLCQQGGSKPFTELVEVASLLSPFEDGCVESIVTEISKWLDGVDDLKL